MIRRNGMNMSVTKKVRTTLSVSMFFYMLLICVVSSISFAAELEEKIGLVQMKLRVEENNGFSDFTGKLSARADRAVTVLVDYSQMMISEKTQVYTQSGLKTDFNQLPIPCSARIIYQQRPDGNMDIVELHIVEVPVEADIKWGDEPPR